MMVLERPRIFLDTQVTSSYEYVAILNTRISNDALGISYLTLAIDPDPNALYRIKVGRIFDVTDIELTAVWSLILPHLTKGVYAGFRAGDPIFIAHRVRPTAPSETQIKTSFTCAFNEVIP
jgi:hypothetical protein